MRREELKQRDLEICNLAAKYTVSEIQKITGLEKHIVKNVLYKYAIRCFHKPNRNQTEKAKKIIELYKSGIKNGSEIARLVGCTRQNVSQVLKNQIVMENLCED